MKIETSKLIELLKKIRKEVSGLQVISSEGDKHFALGQLDALIEMLGGVRGENSKNGRYFSPFNLNHETKT